MKHTRTTTKKVLSVLFALLMVAMSLPFAAAEGTDEPEVLLSGEYGTITWSLTDDGTLTVGGTGAIEPLHRDDEEQTPYYPWEDALANELGFQTLDEAMEQMPYNSFLSIILEVFQNLVIEEGITSIADEAFGDFAFKSITLSSTVESLGEHAIFAPIAESIIVLNPEFSFEDNDIGIMGYLGEESAFSSPDDLLAWILSLSPTEGVEPGGEPNSLWEQYEAYFQLSVAIYSILYDEDNTGYIDFYVSYIMDQAKQYGIDAESFADLTEIVLGQINTALGTNFTDYDQLWQESTNEEGQSTIDMTPALQKAYITAMYGEMGGTPENYALMDTEAILVNLGQELYGYKMIGTTDEETGEFVPEPAGPVTVYPWLTVYGYEGSTAQAAAEASGVNFGVLSEGEHTHVYTSAVTTPATCISTGVRTFTCICGDSYDVVIPIDLNNHINTEEVKGTVPTCTDTGMSDGVWCNDCETWVSGHEVLDKDPNNHGNCDLDDHGNCILCGHFVRNPEDPGCLKGGNHRFNDWEWFDPYGPNCRKTHTCILCGYSETENHAPLVIDETMEDNGCVIDYPDEAYDGNVNLDVEKESYYTDEGEWYMTCWTIQITKDGHHVKPAVPVVVKLELPPGNYDREEVVVFHFYHGRWQTMPTWLEDNYICFITDCLSPFTFSFDGTEPDYIPEDEHTYVEEIDTPATCSSTGLKTLRCECGDFYNEIIEIDPLGHVDENEDGTCDLCQKPVVPDHTPGDINGDGVVNNKDLNRLMKKLAGEDVNCVDAALDVNGDGVVNNKDLNRLMKKLAGEDVQIF